jgi:small subunit ribosomal protein S2
MAVVQVQELIDAGVHYGHRSSRWNPKMRPFIYGKKNLIHIIDLRETVRGMLRATRFLQRIAGQGSLVLFVGTKRQAQESIIREAKRAHMPFVSERWIGGTFTNFRTIRSRLNRLEELEQLCRTGNIDAYSKKRRATLLREMRKITRNLSGIRTMNRLPGAVVVIDASREASAVREARKMQIPTISLIDTDSDPDTVDLVIPGNDDSIRSIDIVLERLANAVIAGYSQLARETVDKLEIDYVKAHTPVNITELKPAEGQAQEVAVESHPASALADESMAPTAETAAVEDETPMPAAE